MSNEWTPEAEQYLREHYPTTSTAKVRETLREQFGIRKALSTVQCKARDMGVAKDAVLLSNIRSQSAGKMRAILGDMPAQRISHPKQGVLVHRLMG